MWTVMIFLVLNILSWIPCKGEKSPDPYDCNSYKVREGDQVQRWSCPSGLHFSPTQLECMFPIEARCHPEYWCPKIDNPRKPVYMAHPLDCTSYFICSKRKLSKRTCDSNLWWNLETNQCVTENEAKCDKRAIINPKSPNICENNQSTNQNFQGVKVTVNGKKNSQQNILSSSESSINTSKRTRPYNEDSQINDPKTYNFGISINVNT